MNNNNYFPLDVFPLCKNSLTISELEKLPFSSIKTLTEVLKIYEMQEDKLCHSKLYNNIIIIISRREKIGICLVTICPDSSIMETNEWLMKIEDSPAFFIQELEEAKAKERLIDGYPAAVIEFNREVRDYLLKKSRSGIKTRLLRWIHKNKLVLKQTNR